MSEGCRSRVRLEEACRAEASPRQAYETTAMACKRQRSDDVAVVGEGEVPGGEEGDELRGWW